jgi:hypothetical protein
MKIVAVVLLLAPAWAQAPLKTAAVVNPPTERPNGMRQVVTSFENHLNDKITGVGGADPVYILGLTRGLYLQGFGAVYTAELDLVATPRPNPFQKEIPKEVAAKVHTRKLQNLALLKKAMHDMWVDAASTLTSFPDTEEVVLAVRLFYQPWEDTTGLPVQIVMKGPRKAAIAGGIQTEEQ